MGATRRVRHVVRVLLVDEEDCLLLLRVNMPSADRTLWIAPGGGLEDGEDPRLTATREVAEETGLTGLDLGAEVWRGRHVFTWRGTTWDQHERWFLHPDDRLMLAHERYRGCVDGVEVCGRRAVRAGSYPQVVEQRALRAAAPCDRAPRLRLFLRERRAAASPRAARQAGRGGRQRAARGGDDRQLRGAAVRGALGDAGRAGAPAVPRRDLHPARLPGLPRQVARGVGHRRGAPGLPDAARLARRGLRRHHGDREAAARAA